MPEIGQNLSHFPEEESIVFNWTEELKQRVPMK
jgi:hypothetical protein